MRRLILAAVLLAPTAAHAGKRYASFMIDRFDMTATLSEPVGLFSTARAYFDRTETASGARVEDRRDSGCLGVFDFAAGGRLLHRARSLAVLEGPFGRVHARFDFWYPPERPRGAVNTSARKDIPHREPVPAAGARGRVDSFALVRVLKDGKKFKIASADYGLDGGLRALRVDRDWLAFPPSEVERSLAKTEAGLPFEPGPGR